ncbi:hypothetical protein THRCLA_02804 [Thraustotheca clavata]|uniref:Uncharacterized protein n=1 Tax=Thraustotheca clavata TaxID=74557 RepID=A0A1W0A3Z6_9STRA|nr:hypothetical protein THRCLA_02804 [Thraustotheca clavata]
MLPPSVGITTTSKLPRKLRQQRQKQKAAVQQAKLSSEIEAYIEREVKKRTQNIEKETRLKITRLDLAYELHVNSEIESYMDEFLASVPASQAKMKLRHRVLNQLFAKPKDPMELSDLDRFRAYLKGNSARLSTQLKDTDAQLANSPGTAVSVNELIETVERLHELVIKQDEQLEQARRLLEIALVKVETSDDIAGEVDQELDAMVNRLERASTEVQILRKSQRQQLHFGTL